MPARHNEPIAKRQAVTSTGAAPDLMAALLAATKGSPWSRPAAAPARSREQRGRASGRRGFVVRVGAQANARRTTVRAGPPPNGLTRARRTILAPIDKAEEGRTTHGHRSQPQRSFEILLLRGASLLHAGALESCATLGEDGQWRTPQAWLASSIGVPQRRRTRSSSPRRSAKRTASKTRRVQDALLVLRRIAVENDRLSVDDCWRELDSPPRHHSQMSALMLAGQRRGWIEKTSAHRRSVRTVNGGRPVRIWRSRIYAEWQATTVPHQSREERDGARKPRSERRRRMRTSGLITEADLIRTLQEGTYTLPELYRRCEAEADIARAGGLESPDADHPTDLVWKHRLRCVLQHSAPPGTRSESTAASG